MRRVGHLPFLWAIRKGHYDGIELLIQEGANPSDIRVIQEDSEENIELGLHLVISCAIEYC
jgi:ankyrin repeat protein